MSIAEFPDVNVRGGAEERGPEDERKDSVLRGLKFAVSCLFPSEDQSIATAVLQEHGGVYAACVEIVHIKIFVLLANIYKERDANQSS